MFFDLRVVRKAVLKMEEVPLTSRTCGIYCIYIIHSYIYIDIWRFLKNSATPKNHPSWLDFPLQTVPLLGCSIPGNPHIYIVTYIHSYIYIIYIYIYITGCKPARHALPNSC